MYYFPDFLAFGVLFLDGFFFGYYFKFAFVYDNYGSHWYSGTAIATALLVAGLWTFKKFKQRQYRFDHFYLVFYGLVCLLISNCLMITEHLESSFHFGFVGHATLFLPAYSFISLRSSSSGLRPCRIALANCTYFAGYAAGFHLFNEFEARDSAWICMGLTLAALTAASINELLQHYGVHDYRQSCDLVFNMMNDEKTVFLPKRSVYAIFVDRPDFFIAQNRQPLFLGLLVVVVLERAFFYSQSVLELAKSSTFGYLDAPHLYGPYLCYAVGGGVGALLMLRYRPKLTFLMFGLVKVTVTAAFLIVYTEDLPENCFLFVCFYYVAMGVYSSVALQGILECSPFLYTELLLAGAYVVELVTMEVLKYELSVDDYWSMLLGIGVATSILTIICIGLVQWLLPESEGLIDVRNHLLGIRRHKAAVSQNKIWSSNYFLHHELQPNEVRSITIGGNRVFQQYPRDIAKRADG